MTNNKFLNKIRDILLDVFEAELKTNNIKDIANTIAEVFDALSNLTRYYNLKNKKQVEFHDKIADNFTKEEIDDIFRFQTYYLYLILTRLLELSPLESFKYIHTVDYYIPNKNFEPLEDKIEFKLSDIIEKGIRIDIPTWCSIFKNNITIHMDVHNSDFIDNLTIERNWGISFTRGLNLNIRSKIKLILEDKNIKRIKLKSLSYYSKYIENIFFYPEENEKGELQTPFEINIEDEELYKLLKPIKN